MLVLICGLPATGKSTIANHLAKKIGAMILRTDIIRKELLPAPKYSDKEKELVYNVTFLIAKYLLKAKRNVIIDGTFYKRALRKRIYKIATYTRSRLEIVECISPEDVIKRRMARRGKRKHFPSDADYQVYKLIKEQFEPIQRRHVVIDTSKHLSANLRELYVKMRL